MNLQIKNMKDFLLKIGKNVLLSFRFKVLKSRETKCS